MKKKILVFSATGQQGFSVSGKLLTAGFHIRAYTRDKESEKARALKEMGAELIEGQLNSAVNLQQAMSGVHGVFLVLPPSWSPTNESDEQEWHTGKLIIDVAKASNVQHIVYSSVMGSELQQPFRPLFKYTIEEYLRESGLNYTIFKPAAFFENFYMPHYGLAEQLIYNPLPAEMKLPFISVQDIGNFTLLAFASPEKFANKTINITGDLITAGELATIFTKAFSTKITAVQVPTEVIENQNELLGKFMKVLYEVGYPSIEINQMKALNPDLLDTQQWLERYGFEHLRKIITTK